MPQKVFETVIPCSPEELFDFHSSVEALTKLTPSDARVEIVGPDTAVRNGALHELKIVKFGLPMIWRARITEVERPHGFRDTAEKSPFASWTHRHDFLPHPEGALLRDTVEYRLPFGPLGAVVDRLVVGHDIDRMFVHRHQVTLDAFSPAPVAR
ncbi:MAG: SRPBCC family protein [Fimbriimonadaceae bacterium]|nr:SRPBCC family protein [Fimbriimonadaceae bacterium]